MKSQIKTHPYFYYVLVEQQFDNFTVLALRDAVKASLKTEYNDLELRNILYRQVLRFEKMKWLESSGDRPNKKYKKTSYFDEKKLKTTNYELIEDNQAHVSVSSLINEKKAYQAELEIKLGEVEHYKLLIERFPAQKKVIEQLTNKAKKDSATLLGKVNALSNVVSALKMEQHIC